MHATCLICSWSDDASRGLRGAIILLLHLHGRWLVVLGALAIALSVAFEPFVQQAPLFAEKNLIELSDSASALQSKTCTGGKSQYHRAVNETDEDRY
jgi:hypothetical protein